MQIAGTLVLLHPPRRGRRRCERCGELAIERRDAERALCLLGGPLVPRSFQFRAVCARCGFTTDEPAPVDPPSRRMVGRMIVSWLAVIAAVVAGVVMLVSGRRLLRERAAAPEVGDVWTIDARRFPGLSGNGLHYGRVQVTSADDDGVTVAACDSTSDDDDTVARACRDFDIDLGHLGRDAIPAMAHDGTIDSIWRGGDPAETEEAVLGACFVVFLGNALLLRRAARRARASTTVPPARDAQRRA